MRKKAHVRTFLVQYHADLRLADPIKSREKYTKVVSSQQCKFVVISSSNAFSPWLKLELSTPCDVVGNALLIAEMDGSANLLTACCLSPLTRSSN